ncbi:DNA damage-inducible protein 1 [Cryptococcus wingfieldii CBS 7118]|uniref:DNA damage-inducible protein 1 n=1 Tax=Cryptococcus wingfieldii CBS 7118 TaxID=1295528 RepID=A0A1E3K473_9TREE|nr:DNA damage-inducible protein 1 [Cryptococcus wingfieldii CBS 7118]ODO07623.1 DNA damage-inducible protein 1 [Cryptococcus wingfieldii CBS 7118]
MRLTIIAPETIHEHEVSPELLVEDLIALVEATAELPPSVIVLTSDSGTPLTDPSRTLDSYGLNGEHATIFLTPTEQPVASSSSSGPLAGSDADIERMRLQALGNPELMESLQERDAELYAAVRKGTQEFKTALQASQLRQRSREYEKEQQIAALNADPYDIEAQKKIEEAIKQAAIMENMEHAIEYSPESFGNVTMLYIDVEVNGFPRKAFVDSGAQSTLISPRLAEECNLMRLADTRFSGMAEGVGSAKILGRVHSAQLKVGPLHLPCSFSILEGIKVDLLFGLDMLKRHQCCIDLPKNCLRVGDVEVPFLAEHELPSEKKREEDRKVAEDMRDAAAMGKKVEATSSAAAGSSFPGAGQSLIGLGAPRDQAIQLLEASGGNVDVAASMLFG